MSAYIGPACPDGGPIGFGGMVGISGVPGSSGGGSGSTGVSNRIACFVAAMDAMGSSLPTDNGVARILRCRRRSRKTWHEAAPAGQLSIRAINAYVKSITGQHFSAKDFRTWNATVPASPWPFPQRWRARRRPPVSGSAPEPSPEPSPRSRSISATRQPSRDLAISIRRVVDRFRGGQTIRDALDRIGVDTPPGHPATQGAIETAVLDPLS